MASTITIPSTSTSNTLFSGISDVFSDLARSRENEYQRKRQEEADARAVIAAESVERNRQQLYDHRAALEAERLAAIDAQLTESEFVDAMRTFGGVKNIPEMKGSYGLDPSQASGWDEIIRNRVPDTGIIPNVNRRATAEERHGAQFNLTGRLPRDQVLNMGTLQSYAASVQSQLLQLEKAERQALADGDTAAVRKLQIEKAQLENESKKLQNEQNRKHNEAIRIATGETYKPGVGPRSSSDAYNFRPGPTRGQDPVDPRYFNPDDPEWKQAEKYYTAYGPKSQADFATIADVASGRRNWDTSLDKSGYTTSQANTLAETFAPQFATQFNDSDNVTRRESEQMSNYALAAARQIFNNPDIQLPSGTKAIDLYNQILSQRDLYAKDTYPNIVGINYEPITEVATIIKNWQNLNNPETEQQLRVRLTNQARSQFPTATPTQIEATVNARIQQLGG